MMFKRKGGGIKGLLNNVKKKLHFSLVSASLTVSFIAENFDQVKKNLVKRIFDINMND